MMTIKPIDVYLLDNNFERIAYLEEFDSFAWTERHAAHGDFEMVLPASKKWDVIRRGRYIAHTATRAVMIIESIQDGKDSEGRLKRTIKGRSLESLLMRRSVIPWVGRSQWLVKATIGQAVYYLIRNFMMDNSGLDSRDVIPDMYVANDTRNSEVAEIAVNVKSLYDAVKELCDTKDFDFGVDLLDNSPRLRFYVYEGEERDNAIFSTQNDTLAEENYLETDTDYYNVAYVFSNDNERRVQTGLNSLNPDLSGVDRRVLSVYASDLKIDDEITLYSRLDDLLVQRGREELAKHKRVTAFDGKLTGLDPYLFKAHYKLGDIVNLMDNNSKITKVRVAEYMWGVDDQGTRAYPTFTTLD